MWSAADVNLQAAPKLTDNETCFSTSFGPACAVSSVQQIPAELLEGSFTRECRDLRYYEVLEESLEGQFEHEYLILQNTSTGQVAIQPIFFVDQDILDGLPDHLRSVLASPRKFLPRWLRMRMLVVGCSAGDGALDCTEPWAIEALREALALYAHASKASMVLLKDFPAKYREVMRPLTQHGYRRVPSMPACTLDLDFGSFEEYMQKRLGRSFRESLRRKLKKSRQHSPVEMEVLTDVTPIAEEIEALYLQTYHRSKMRFERLTADFFARIGRAMPERVRFFIWRVEGKMAAFSLCLVHEGTLYHLNVGFDYAVALPLHLYFVTLRDLIQWSLENGLKRYYTGQLNYDPKLHLRMRLFPLDLYARHTSPILNPAFKLALGFLQPARHDPIIRQFANADEL